MRSFVRRGCRCFRDRGIGVGVSSPDSASPASAALLMISKAGAGRARGETLPRGDALPRSELSNLLSAPLPIMPAAFVLHQMFGVLRRQ